MGGGRRTFLTKDDLDPETNAVDSKGRLDGRNLITVICHRFITLTSMKVLTNVICLDHTVSNFSVMSRQGAASCILNSTLGILKCLAL